MTIGVTVAGFGSAAAQPGDYGTLPVDPNLITDSLAYNAAPPTFNPNGQPGVTAVYTHRDGSRQITSTILVLPDAQAATATLSGAQPQVTGMVANGKTEPAAVGTGGTITGCYDVIKPKKPSFQAIAVEPKDSAVISQTLAGLPVKPGPHKIQGTGAGFVPKNLHLNGERGNPQITECIQVTNEDAFAMARRLAKEEGILAGISSGANVWAAIEVAKRTQNKGKMIVTVACSTGERYLSTPLAAEARAAVGG